MIFLLPPFLQFSCLLSCFLIFFVCLFVLFVFLGLPLWHMEGLWLEVTSELQLGPKPQPQQRWIQAVSANYAAACSNARSLTHWSRPKGLNSHPYRHYVRFLTCWATTRTPWFFFFKLSIFSFSLFHFFFFSIALKCILSFKKLFFLFFWSHHHAYLTWQHTKSNAVLNAMEYPESNHHSQLACYGCLIS